MYELQYTQQIVDAIMHELHHAPEQKIKSVKVQVGQSYQLDPQDIHTHYADIVVGTPLEGTTLFLQEALLEVQCNACGFSGPLIGPDLMMCSTCRSRNVKLIAGELVNVLDVELYPL